MRESATPVEPVGVEDGLVLAAAEMAHRGLPAVPVVEAGRLVGTVSEAGLCRALASGASAESTVSGHLEPAWPALHSEETGAAALRLISSAGAPGAVVTDGAGRVVALVTPSRLLAPVERAERPRLVGGMATPFGVYLTNGVVGAGAGGWALVSTGALLFGLFAAATYVANAVATALPQSALPAWFGWGGSAFSSLVFFVLLRSIPLAGTHAAEHKVVHAIERGLPLTLPVVSRMPRIHPRCGTNIAVGAMLFLAVGTVRWTPVEELRLLAAALAALLLWRPVGGLMQAWVTTKPPTAAQLRSGIRAGEELLERLRSPAPESSLGRRIASSGLLHIVGGSAAAEVLLWVLETVLQVPAAYRVIS